MDRFLRILLALDFALLCILALVCLTDPSWSSRDHAQLTGFALEEGR